MVPEIESAYQAQNAFMTYFTPIAAITTTIIIPSALYLVGVARYRNLKEENTKLKEVLKENNISLTFQRH